MRQINLVLAGMAALVFAVGLSGCGDGGDPVQTNADRITGNLAQLSDADRTEIKAQEDCPVSTIPLGSIGEPIKMTVKDTKFWICCDDCKVKLKADPDTYLAKLKKE